MSEVTSVNGKTGAVVLTASNVEAVPESEAGQPDGVATLNGEGRLPGAQLPDSVVQVGPVVNTEPVLMYFGTYTHGIAPFVPDVQPALFEVGAKLNTSEPYTLIAGFVANEGSGEGIAIYGEAISLPPSGEVWASNLIAYTNGAKTKVTGLEIDFGHKAKTQRIEPEPGTKAYGLTIQYFPEGVQEVNPFPLIQISNNKHSPNTRKFKATTVEGSPTLSGISAENIEKLAPGQELSGTGIPSKTTILEVKPSEGKLVMNANATKSGEAELTRTETRVVYVFEATLTEGSRILSEVTSLTGISTGLEVKGAGIPAGAIIEAFSEKEQTVTLTAAATTSEGAGVKCEAIGSENMGCLYGIRFVAENGTQLISSLGTAVDFHNIGTCRYGLDFETNTFTGAALHFGKSKTALAFALGEAELEKGVIELGANKLLASRPKVTGSKGGNAALTSLCEKLAELGLITNETT